MTEKKQEIKVSPHFFLRRMHSLSGVVPIGAFLLEHMFTNSFILKGAQAYNEKIEFLTSIPFLPVLEIGFIALPILYHAFYGFYVMFTGKSNLSSYPHRENWLYMAQRWTGMLTFIYISYHVYHTRIVHILYGTEVSYARMADLMHDPRIFCFYLVGLAAAMFHFANGVWGFLISWGITIGPKSQKAAGFACAAVGFWLYFVGASALIHLVK